MRRGLIARSPDELPDATLEVLTPKDALVTSLSRGMTQRLALCRVLLHDPALLVLDEPYTALDEQGAELLDAQLGELRGQRTFLVSTHDPARTEPLATAHLALA